jgi:hypothetical protein
MLYSKIIAVCSQIHTKHTNTLCGQNVQLLNVKAGGTYSDQWALRGLQQQLLYILITFVVSTYPCRNFKDYD